MSRIFLALTALFALLAQASALAGDRVTGELFATRSEIFATSGMAATSQPLATQVALDILKQGGNAVDAAIAVNAMLGLVEPTGNGIGGDLFAIVWDAREARLHGLNASGRSPQSLTRQMLLDQGLQSIPSHGPLPVSVPGCVDGWFELHERLGRLPLGEILAPAIRYAREGFPVSELVAFYWDRSVPILSRWPGFAEQFTIDGRAPRKGEIWRNPNLADTLEKLVTGGRDAFYRGEIARTIDRYLRENEGHLSYEDLATHRSEWVDPVSVDYRGHRVWELPPNTQGVAALQMLEILEEFDLATYGFGSVEHVHLFVEAKKLAFEDRARFYGDPEFCDVPLDGLLDADYAADRRELIDLQRAARRVAAGNPALGDGDTIYLSVADADGNMVSLIQSNYRGMGSGMSPPGLGFILQDRGELFSLAEGHCNVYEPGKRPFHTIIPAFVTKDGQPWLSFGVMGGDMQPQGHVQILLNLIDFGMNLQEDGDAPRIYHSGSSEPTGGAMADGGTVYLESGFPTATVRELQARGHRVAWARGPFGGYQAVQRNPETGVFVGASESRKDGQAAGF
jgi:gamma-glutamyltranspeptidase/glutathione hydrolase